MPEVQRRAARLRTSGWPVTALSCAACSCAQSRSPRHRSSRAARCFPDAACARATGCLPRSARADQAVLRFLRTRGHAEPAETVMKALGHAGEFAAVWAGIGAVGASIDHRRRGQWLIGGATGPLAIGVNFVVKLAVGRQRPLIEDHPPLAKAPTKLSFPVCPRDVVRCRGHRPWPRRAARAAVPVRACNRDLRRAPLSRDALPVRRPRRRGARLRDRDGRPRARDRADRGAPVRAGDRRERARTGDRHAPGNGGVRPRSRDGRGRSRPA